LLDLYSHTSIRTLNHLCLHNGDIICRLVDRSDQWLPLLLVILSRWWRRRHLNLSWLFGHCV
jgi:hypothetical protein